MQHLPRNFIAAVGFGSFATVGDATQSTPPDLSPGLYLAMEVGQACQLRCRHCIYQDDRSMRGRPSPGVIQALREAIAQGMSPKWVSFAGKEPTLFPRELLDMARIVKDPSCTRILMTNGLLLRGELLAELTGLIDCFDVSIDGDKARHEWMRGPGMFEQTMGAVERLEQLGNTVGVIATATGDDAQSQFAGSIPTLARDLRERFGNSGQVSLSISLYYGRPGDPLRLSGEDIVELIKKLSQVDFPTRVLYTAPYAHLWEDVARALSISPAATLWDVPTGFPMVRIGNLDVILFNQAHSLQLAMRVSNGGDVFIGCNHLVLGADAREHRVGSIAEGSLSALNQELLAGNHPAMGHLALLPDACGHCDRYDSCRGGDQLSGMLFTSKPADPYCDRI